jgi:hypothetical protein
MIDVEGHAFWRGYKDYRTYDEQKRLRMAQAFDSVYSPPFRPPEGHEEAYQAGWETAKLESGERPSGSTEVTTSEAWPG